MLEIDNPRYHCSFFFFFYVKIKIDKKNEKMASGKNVSLIGYNFICLLSLAQS